MWFKRVWLGYCAATLAVTIVTASSSQDATHSQRRHVLEHLDYPQLERRQQPAGNQTSSSDVTQSTSSIISKSNVITPSTTPRSSTIVQTSLIVTTVESSATTAPVPTSFPETTHTTGTESGSSVSDVSSSSSVISTKVTIHPTSATAEQPTETSIRTRPTSIIVEPTSIIPSTTEETRSSNTPEMSSSAESTPTPSQVDSSSKTLTSSSAILISTSNASTLQLPPSSVTSSADDTAVSSLPVEPTPSSISPTSTQIETSERSSTAATTPVEPTSTSISATTPVEQQSSAVFSTSSSTASTPIPSTASQDPVTSGLAVEPSTLPQETLPTSSPETAPLSSSAPAVSSAAGRVSSSEDSNLPTSEISPVSIITTSSAGIESSARTLVTSETVAPSTISSTIAFNPTPSQVETSSVADTPSLPSSTSLLETPSTPIVSDTGLPSPSSSEDPVSSNLPESTPVVSADTSSFAPPTLVSSQVDTITSSTHTLDPQSSLQPPSSPISELSSTLVDVTSTSSLVLSSASPSNPSSTATGIAPSLSATSSAPIDTAPAPQSSSSANNGPLSSVAGVVSSDTSSFSSPSSSFMPTPLPTTLGGTSSLVTAEIPATTLSPDTSVTSGGFSMSEIISSAMSSETIASSTFVPSTSPHSAGGSAGISLGVPPSTATFSGTQPSFSEQPSTSSPIFQLSTLSVPPSSEVSVSLSQASSRSDLAPASTSLSSTLESFLLSSSIASGGQTFLSTEPTSVVASSTNSTAGGSIPTSEATSLTSTQLPRGSSQVFVPTQSALSSTVSSGLFTTTNTVPSISLSSATFNGSRTQPSRPFTSGIVTATFSTVYVSSIRSSTLDLSTVAFSFFSSVTEAATNRTNTRISSMSATQVPASETLTSLSRIGTGANSTSPLQPSLTKTGRPGGLTSTITTNHPGVTFSRSALPTGSSAIIAPSLNGTRAETLQTSSMQSAVNSTNAGVIASTSSDSASSTPTDVRSSTSTTTPDEASTTDNTGIDGTQTHIPSYLPTPTPSETAAADKPPPLTTSQTAGVAVGATTGLLIAVVAAIFLARRYHAAKQGKRMSTGSVYPKVAYLYDPKTGGEGGDAEALMSGGTSGLPPSGSASKATAGPPKHMQRHSTGAMPTTRLTSPRGPFQDSIRHPTTQRYSEYARLDTARALSAAVAGYGAAPRHSSSYTKYPSTVTNPFSDHIIPSPTFAPFSPDDIQRPEIPPASNANGGRGEYSQVPLSEYSYLNAAASMYPPISPYEGPSTQGPSPAHDIRRHTLDSNPFADPFEHDLILQVDERNRTSDSVTVFAGSPNLMSPRTPRTPVGPKLPVRQPNGMTSSRSLLSPVAAKYMHKAQEVKIPRKSIASPVLVQVGRSPVIKPFSPPPAAPEHRGWDDIKRHSEKRFSDEQSVPAPLMFKAPVVPRKPVPASHTAMKPSLTGAGQALLAGTGLPLTVNIPHMYKKSVGLDVPRVHARPDQANEDVSADPVVREKRSRELRFADPALIGKDF